MEGTASEITVIAFNNRYLNHLKRSNSMNEQQLEKRKQKAKQPMVITKEETGFRVQSSSNAATSYLVAASRGILVCTCPDYERHEGEESYFCKHILAVKDFVLSQATMEKQAQSNGNTKNKQEAESITHTPLQKAPNTNGTESPATRSSTISQPHMLIKRSLSPDTRIDCVSIEIDFNLADCSVSEIKAKAAQALKLQNEIAKEFLMSCESSDRHAEPSLPQAQVLQPQVQVTPAAVQPFTPIPAKMLSIGVMQSQWGPRYFITLDINGKSVKLFGSQKQLAKQIAVAGYAVSVEQIQDGAQLNVPCKVTVKPSNDGRFLNVETVFPA
jgi:hypothetical protein